MIEHNVLVISKYYSRITTKRLATLLCLTEKEVRVQPALHLARPPSCSSWIFSAVHSATCCIDNTEVAAAMCLYIPC